MPGIGPRGGGPAAAAVALVVAGIGLARAGGPVPPVALAAARVTIPAFPGVLPRLPWPRVGEAAVAVDGVGMLGATSVQRPVPIASVTKVMTALIVLRDHPLRPGERGPILVMTAADQSVYRSDNSAGDSTLPVRAGEPISERQLLEGLLIPSGDNAAWTLARWDAGSVAAFIAAMNEKARTLGLPNTRYADVSGVDPESESSAVDQTHLAEVALRNPVFAAIVRRAQVVLPVAGRLRNPDPLAGRPYISGVKTGWTPQAGGCLVLARWSVVAGSPVTVVATALGQRGPTPLPAAARVADRLAVAARGLLRVRVVSLAGRVVGELRTSWQRPVPLVAVGAARLVGWPGLAVTVRVHLGSRPRTLPIPDGAQVGTVVITAGAQRVSLAVRTTRALLAPSLLWRVTGGS